MSEYRNHSPHGPAAGISNPPPEPSRLSPDVTLLLRTHSEQRWLSREVIPVVRQLETRERLPEEQLPAAAAYLEVIWADAAARARETDAALLQLEALDPTEKEGPGSPYEKEGPGSPSWSRLRHPLAPHPLPARARRYHAAVQGLREAVARRVTPLIEHDLVS